MRKTLLRKLNKSLKSKKMKMLAKEIGISYLQLYRIVNELVSGKIETWEKIETYYNQK